MIKHALPEDLYQMFMSTGEIAVALGIDAGPLDRRLKKWAKGPDVTLRAYYKPSARGWWWPMPVWHIEDVIRIGVNKGYLYGTPYYYSIVKTRMLMAPNPRVEKAIDPVWRDPFDEELK